MELPGDPATPVAVRQRQIRQYFVVKLVEADDRVFESLVEAFNLARRKVVAPTVGDIRRYACEELTRRWPGWIIDPNAGGQRVLDVLRMHEEIYGPNWGVLALELDVKDAHFTRYKQGRLGAGVITVGPNHDEFRLENMKLLSKFTDAQYRILNLIITTLTKAPNPDELLATSVLKEFAKAAAEKAGIPRITMLPLVTAIDRYEKMYGERLGIECFAEDLVEGEKLHQQAPKRSGCAGQAAVAIVLSLAVWWFTTR